MGILAGVLIANRQAEGRFAARLRKEEQLWRQEKAGLEAALAESREEARRARGRVHPVPEASAPDAERLSPEEILARIERLRAGPGPNRGEELREIVYWLEELRSRGPEALPAIRSFLARYQDIELETSLFQTRSKNLPLDFILPPTLRFGLFEVVRRVGGPAAEEILSECLGQTGRGLEVAWLARALQEMAPNQHRNQALEVARALLASAAPLNSSSPLDRHHREYLFEVLEMFGDGSFASTAAAQLVQADNRVDPGALHYLQQTLGPGALPVVTQTYRNPALTNSAAREPLARLALSYVGTDANANELYQQAINDPLLTKNHRRNLIEDLNEDGLDFKNLTERDLPIIENRLALIEKLAPSAMDEANAAAFKEAYKDLQNMRAKIGDQAAEQAARAAGRVP